MKLQNSNTNQKLQTRQVKITLQPSNLELLYAIWYGALFPSLEGRKYTCSFPYNFFFYSCVFFSLEPVPSSMTYWMQLKLIRCVHQLSCCFSNHQYSPSNAKERPSNCINERSQQHIFNDTSTTQKFLANYLPCEYPAITASNFSGPLAVGDE